MAEHSTPVDDEIHGDAISGAYGVAPPPPPPPPPQIPSVALAAQASPVAHILPMATPFEGLGTAIPPTLTTMTVKDQQKLLDIVRHCRHIGVENFDGSLDSDKAIEWLKKIEKAFTFVEMSDAEKISTARVFLQGVDDNWMDRLHHLHREGLTWEMFVIQFEKEYISKTYRKAKQDAFFRLTQDSMTVREYVDTFEDFYRFAADLVPSEDAKYVRFFSGLRVSIRSKLATHEGSSYLVLVDKALEVEKLRKEEREMFQKRRKHGQSSFHDSEERSAKRGGSAFQFRSGFRGSGRDFQRRSTQQRSRPQASQSSVQTSVGSSVGPRGPSVKSPRRSRFLVPPCGVCGKRHRGDCKKTIDECFQCGQPGHFKRECPLLVPGSGSRKGSIASRSQRGGRTQSHGRSAIVGNSAERPNEDTSSSHHMQSAQTTRPQAQTRSFAMTQQEALASPEVVTGKDPSSSINHSRGPAS